MGVQRQKDMRIEQAQQGDLAAFEELVREHERKIYNLCFSTMGSAEDAAMGNLSRQELFRRIHALPEKTREVVYLRLSGELPFSEIGAILGESETWARVTFYRAKQKLLEGGGV